MADKFTKKAVSSSEAADAWKDTLVEKEVQPAKVKSDVTYRQMENQLASLDSQISSLGDKKTALQAEMAKVKAAAES
jgi:hypothetical protein